jgi:predicted tellurium resistance membrane protein TerC
MTRKVLRALELALLALISAGEWVINWIERQSTAIILGLGMLLGVAATMIVGAIYASLR